MAEAPADLRYKPWVLFSVLPPRVLFLSICRQFRAIHPAAPQTVNPERAAVFAANEGPQSAKPILTPSPWLPIRISKDLHGDIPVIPDWRHFSNYIRIGLGLTDLRFRAITRDVGDRRASRPPPPPRSTPENKDLHDSTPGLPLPIPFPDRCHPRLSAVSFCLSDVGDLGDLGDDARCRRFRRFLQPSACGPQPETPPPIALCCKQRPNLNSTERSPDGRSLFSRFSGLQSRSIRPLFFVFTVRSAEGRKPLLWADC